MYYVPVSPLAVQGAVRFGASGQHPSPTLLHNITNTKSRNEVRVSQSRPTLGYLRDRPRVFKYPK